MTRHGFLKSLMIASIAMGGSGHQASAFSGPSGNLNNNNNPNDQQQQQQRQQRANNNNNNENNNDNNLSPNLNNIDNNNPNALSNSNNNMKTSTFDNDIDAMMMPSMVEPQIAYRSLSMDIMTTETTGVTIPVAVWYPTKPSSLSSSSSSSSSSTKNSLSSSKSNKILEYPKVPSSESTDNDSPTYNHRISVKRIGQLLVGWEFIPDFASQDFPLQPSISKEFVVKGETIPFPEQSPVVILAHGYLGSRFDLSHLAEKLAQEGFTCVSPEYPESLAASYPRQEPPAVLDRSMITSQLVQNLKDGSWGIHPTSFGIVGHSLGCGTALSSGDDSWTRVCIAGGMRKLSSVPPQSPVLFISSTNDGAVSLSNMGGLSSFLPSDYIQLQETDIRQNMNMRSSGSSSTSPSSFERRDSQTPLLPTKAAFILDGTDAPNHISYLSEGVNDAMIDLLSPLLPVAQMLSIPVLDFDKYQISRDSQQTASVVIPLISTYLKQNMMIR
eukprot:CAMPEP_0195287762 /NCGR_PEP_ID=MMETSP0707-20130614/4692_1 /TAXON_ID=33640 /ORGANISM="Asterionellopsis glacialis, Strain CCMP134" /LENGTH=497 /DNA_ID=CAMNT_0040347547 /DNA_START=152 /DNA_END=1645 /DNA_ORIENTATION=-